MLYASNKDTLGICYNLLCSCVQAHQQGTAQLFQLKN